MSILINKHTKVITQRYVVQRNHLVLVVACISFVGLSACSLKSVDAAKLACAAEIQAKLSIDVSNIASTWSAEAGTSGKHTTISYNQTKDTPAIECVTSGGKVKSLTQSQTTKIK